MVSFGSVKEKTYELIEQGEYVFTLHEIGESQGQWGDRLVWKWLVAPTSDYAAYICNKNGDERTVWVFTDVDIVLGSIQHKVIETLTGKTFGKDSSPPDEDDLIGKRLVAYLTHETPTRGKNAGTAREAIVAGSIKPFKGPGKTVAKNGTRPEPTAEQEAHAEVKAEVEKLIGRAVKLGTPNHLDYIAIDLESADVTELQMVRNTIQAEVAKALLGDD